VEKKTVKYKQRPDSFRKAENRKQKGRGIQREKTTGFNTCSCPRRRTKKWNRPLQAGKRKNRRDRLPRSCGGGTNWGGSTRQRVYSFGKNGKHKMYNGVGGKKENPGYLLKIKVSKKLTWGGEKKVEQTREK